MDRFEGLTEAMTQCAASLEQLANAIRQSETALRVHQGKTYPPSVRQRRKACQGA